MRPYWSDMRSFPFLSVKEIMVDAQGAQQKASSL